MWVGGFGYRRPQKGEMKEGGSRIPCIRPLVWDYPTYPDPTRGALQHQRVYAASLGLGTRNIICSRA